MKKAIFLLTIQLFLFSCVSTKGTQLIKGRTHLKTVQGMYIDKTKNESLIFYKTFTSATSNKSYDVYVATETGINNPKTVAGTILNHTTRYLVFNSESIYVDTIQNPWKIQKNIDKL
jgi:hypothetical protein